MLGTRESTTLATPSPLKRKGRCYLRIGCSNLTSQITLEGQLKGVVQHPSCHKRLVPCLLQVCIIAPSFTRRERPSHTF